MHGIDKPPTVIVIRSSPLNFSFSTFTEGGVQAPAVERHIMMFQLHFKMATVMVMRVMIMPLFSFHLPLAQSSGLVGPRG